MKKTYKTKYKDVDMNSHSLRIQYIADHLIKNTDKSDIYKKNWTAFSGLHKLKKHVDQAIDDWALRQKNGEINVRQLHLNTFDINN